MITDLSRGQRRFLALTLPILLLVLLFAAIAVPIWSTNRHYHDLITSMTDQLDIYKRVATHSKEYQAEYQHLVKLQQQDERYLRSATESLATAELQQTVKLVVGARNGEVLSTQVLRTMEEEGFKRVLIRVRMRSHLEDMVAIFHSLESQKPLLFIDNVTIRSRPVPRNRLPDDKALRKALRLLDIDFQLSGYMRGEQE